MYIAIFIVIFLFNNIYCDTYYASVILLFTIIYILVTFLSHIFIIRLLYFKCSFKFKYIIYNIIDI